MKIALVCAGGMSTSMLVSNMKKYVDDGDVVEAFAVANLEKKIEEFDVVLLGPQVRYLEKETKDIADKYGKKFAVIDLKTFGSMDGKAAVSLAKSL